MNVNVNQPQERHWTVLDAAMYSHLLRAAIFNTLALKRMVFKCNRDDYWSFMGVLSMKTPFLNYHLHDKNTLGKHHDLLQNSLSEFPGRRNVKNTDLNFNLYFPVCMSKRSVGIPPRLAKLPLLSLLGLIGRHTHYPVLKRGVLSSRLFKNK